MGTVAHESHWFADSSRCRTETRVFLNTSWARTTFASGSDLAIWPFWSPAARWQQRLFRTCVCSGRLREVKCRRSGHLSMLSSCYWGQSQEEHCLSTRCQWKLRCKSCLILDYVCLWDVCPVCNVLNRWEGEVHRSASWSSLDLSCHDKFAWCWLAK